MVYFGDNFHEDDGFEFNVGCVQRETKYFYSQDADGILGLANSSPAHFKPIYKALFDQSKVETA